MLYSCRDIETMWHLLQLFNLNNRFHCFQNDIRAILNRILKPLVRSYILVMLLLISPSVDPTVLVDFFWFVKGK